MRLRILPAIVLAVAMPVIAGCSDTSGGDEVADGTIVIGTLVGEPLLREVAEGAVDEINDAGGIDGHQVKLIAPEVPDGQGLQAVKEMIERDKVTAIVGMTDPKSAAWEKYAAQMGVPVIGGTAIDIAFVTNPSFFAVGTNALAVTAGAAVLASEQGPTLGALYCAEEPACAQAPTLFEFMGSQTGVTVPVKAKVSGTATDYTAQCQSLIDGKVNSYTVAADGPIVVKVAEACADQGLEAPLVLVDGVLREPLKSIPALDGAAIVASTIPFSDKSVPGVAAFHKLIEERTSGGDEVGTIAFQIYTSFQLFKKAVENGGADDVSADSIKEGLYMMKDETLGGMTPPLTFVPGRPNLVNCYFRMTIEDGEFSSEPGQKPECADPDIINLILQNM